MVSEFDEEQKGRTFGAKRRLGENEFRNCIRFLNYLKISSATFFAANVFGSGKYFFCADWI